MKTNKLDTNIKEKFAKRTLEPSTSAWERLSVQLDEQPKQKKKGWFFYIGAAASILLLVSIGIQFFNSEKETILPKDIVVEVPIDTNSIDKKIELFINEIPVEEAIVENKNIENREKKQDFNKNIIANKVEQSFISKKTNVITKYKTTIIQNKKNTIIAKVEENKNRIPKIEESKKIKYLKQDPNSKIKINSDDLLYAVTHSPQEVKTYYAKYKVDRNAILKTIQDQLKESNLKVNPETILAEVERTIDDDDFQNNFMKLLKRRVSDIATVIASRND
ncbi:hypothetical protein [Polaribacter ponticola]|uniref:Anti-sigma factor n=1 Tax=Polaribacter ponticola TaxID=2978475 RepID=A0ABT5S767_9FLAO|nr:hypothetical protein [Polaribacter sp. MSW5]MDD7913948.1 hypothetical protein [Polaribacter sp. MSW5]